MHLLAGTEQYSKKSKLLEQYSILLHVNICQVLAFIWLKYLAQIELKTCSTATKSNINF